MFYPMCCCPTYGTYGGNNDGFSSSWAWAIIIVVFIIFFLFWGSGTDRGRN